MAAAVMSPEMLEQSLLYPKQSVELDMTFQNVMSVDVPRVPLQDHTARTRGRSTPTALPNTSGELDDAVSAMSQVFQDMLQLAEIEKTSQLLAEEIEKTRRRVNALEYVKIPEMQENIKYITMKLDENERANTIRLMKVKELPAQETPLRSGERPTPRRWRPSPDTRRDRQAFDAQQDLHERARMGPSGSHPGFSQPVQLCR